MLRSCAGPRGRPGLLAPLLRAPHFWRAAPNARTLAYVAPGETREGQRRKQNFWRKWDERSQQEFWQDVAFDHDRKNDARRTAGMRVRKGAPSGEKPEKKQHMDDDEYFLSDDAEAMVRAGGLEASEYLDGVEWMESYEEDEDEDSVVRPRNASARWQRGLDASTRAANARASRAHQALLRDSAGVDPARRAELLELLEDLGPDGLRGPPKMPLDVASARNDGALLQTDLAQNLQTSRSLMSSIELRESGLLPEGGYFAYLLNTRRVSKVSAEGKRTSYSSLVVVGNGKGTAGIGMGKDVQPGNALYKATVDARKSLTYVERFDERTLFHAIEDRFAKTKLVIRLRRPGSGTRCSWTVWKILSAFGITDLSVKCHGSRNPTSVAHAVMNALQRSSSAQQVASRRGLRVLDMSPDEIKVPGY